MARLFGFEIKRFKDGRLEDQPVSFSPDETISPDSLQIDSGVLSFSSNSTLEIQTKSKNETELITRYRGMAIQPEISQALDDIVNEAINIDAEDDVVNVVLDDVDLPDDVKEQISTEFDNLLRLLDFSNAGYDIFYRFYVDGRLNYHAIIDEKKLNRGIVELRFIDPRKIRKIVEYDKKQLSKDVRFFSRVKKNEYYIYSESAFLATTTSLSSSNDSIRIAKDSIIRVTSGLTDETNSTVLGYLHPAIKPLNQLRILEDALIIYTLTRAPERRIFYIDVGTLPKHKAEQYLSEMATRHKNKLQYDSTTGSINEQRRHQTMTEDLWFPRRGGERTTEVDILAGGSAPGLSGDENMQYFLKKLYKSLKVPSSRLETENMFNIGRASEITRDELKFSKFIRRTRGRFTILFDELLEKQLILKGILTPAEWKDVKNKIKYRFARDNYFEQLKQQEILRENLGILRDIEDYVGTYYTREYVRKNVLFQDDEEIKYIKKQIQQEIKDGEIPDPNKEDDSF